MFLSRFQISTLATKLGVRNIAFLGSGLLLANYIGAVVAAIYMPQVSSFFHIGCLIFYFMFDIWDLTGLLLLGICWHFLRS